jgi:hypothetical protein
VVAVTKKTAGFLRFYRLSGVISRSVIERQWTFFQKGGKRAPMAQYGTPGGSTGLGMAPEAHMAAFKANSVIFDFIQIEIYGVANNCLTNNGIAISVLDNIIW